MQQDDRLVYPGTGIENRDIGIYNSNPLDETVGCCSFGGGDNLECEQAVGVADTEFTPGYIL